MREKQNNGRVSPSRDLASEGYEALRRGPLSPTFLEDWMTSIEQWLADADERFQDAASTQKRLRGDVQIMARLYSDSTTARSNSSPSCTKAQEPLVDEEKENLRKEAAEAKALRTQVQALTRKCELLTALESDGRLENTELHKAFNDELDQMYEDTQQPENVEVDSLRRQVKQAKAERNQLRIENKLSVAKHRVSTSSSDIVNDSSNSSNKENPESTETKPAPTSSESNTKESNWNLNLSTNSFMIQPYNEMLDLEEDLEEDDINLNLSSKSSVNIGRSSMGGNDGLGLDSIQDDVEDSLDETRELGSGKGTDGISSRISGGNRGKRNNGILKGKKDKEESEWSRRGTWVRLPSRLCSHRLILQPLLCKLNASMFGVVGKLESIAEALKKGRSLLVLLLLLLPSSQVADMEIESTKPLEDEISSIESIPEEIALHIFHIISSWAEMRQGGSLEEKEQRTKMRDSALGAIALTSSRNLIRWRPYLFQRVTLHFSNVLSFALFLSNQAGLVRSVRSLRFLEVRREDPEKLVQITAYSALPGRRSSDPADDDFGLRHVGSGMMTITSFLLNCLSSLEELIVDHDIFLFNFQTRDPNVEKTIPLPFLAKSLKKLYVKLTGPDYIALSARNFIWLMLFCSALNELAIGFTLSETDISFLTEFKESFKNKSKIKKLAIQFRFVASLSGKKNSKWKLYGKQCKSGLSKIQKEQALLDLLLVTSGLQAFEINGTASLESFSEEERPDFRTVLSSGLSSSSETLHHHRNFLSLQEAGSGRPASSFNSSPFQNVKILSTERHGLVFMKREGLRSNIEVIQLTWYVTSAGLLRILEILNTIQKMLI
ncbi:hypothetical protein L7F22_034265 [Adiantum nelumboides]|nr:hypothetical protein [Adiantum nelumboides]